METKRELQRRGALLLLRVRLVAMLVRIHFTTWHLGKYDGAAASATAGEAGSRTTADVDAVTAGALAAAAGVTGIVVASGRLPSVRTNDNVGQIPSKSTRVPHAVPAPASQKRHPIRLYPLLFLKDTRNSSAHALKASLFFFLFFSFLSMSLPCSRFRPLPLSVVVTRGPHTAAAAGKTVQAAAVATAPCRATAQAALAAPTAAVMLRRTESASVAVLSAAPAAAILRRRTAETTQPRPETGAALLGVSPAAPLSRLAAITAAAAVPLSRKGRVSGERLIRCCASVASPLCLWCLQQDPTFFAAAKLFRSCPFPFHTELLPNRSAHQQLKQAPSPPALQGAAAAAAALWPRVTLKRDTAGRLPHLPVPLLRLSLLQQHSAYPPAGKDPQQRMRACTSSRAHSAALSLISSKQPHSTQSENLNPRCSSPLPRAADVEQRLVGLPATSRQEHPTLTISSLFLRLASPLDSPSVSSHTALLPSLCHTPLVLIPAHDTAFGRRCGRRARCSRTAASAATVKKSYPAHVSSCIRSDTFPVKCANNSSPAATWRQLRSTARRARTVCAVVSRALVLFQRTHTITGHTCPVSAEATAPPALHAQASSSKRCQSEALSRVSTCSFPVSSPALFANSALVAAFLRLPLLHQRPTSRLLPRNYSTSASHAGCFTQVVAPYAAVVALEKGATQRSMPALHRQQQLPSHAMCGGRIPFGDKACPTQRHTSRQGLHRDALNNSSSGRVHTLQKWPGYVSSTSDGSDFSCRQRLFASPPRRGDKAFYGSSKRGEKGLLASETASSQCVFRRPTWFQRAAAAAVYLIPYLELFHMFLPFLTSLLPSMAPAWKGLAHILELYARFPCSSLLTFVAPYTFIIKKQSFLKPSYFLRHHTMTALLLSMLQYTMSMIYFKGFRGSFADGSSPTHETIVLSLFLSVQTLLFNAVSHALAGEYVWIPVVTEAVNMHIGDKPTAVREFAKDSVTKFRQVRPWEGSSPESKT